MKVLMFGWEFPPFKSGGLGTHCYGLTKALSQRNIDLAFVMPHTGKEPKPGFVRIIQTDLGKFFAVGSSLRPYIPSLSFSVGGKAAHDVYGLDFFQAVSAYTKAAVLATASEPCDIIHCQDWMTYPAGVQLKEMNGKPLVVTIHSTEFDRTGNLFPNEWIKGIEKWGMEKADRVITVSHYMKRQLVERYKIPAEKIDVVYNAVEAEKFASQPKEKFGLNEKIVLFLGRLTIQKGCEFFLDAAAKILEKQKNIRFVVVGSGDMMPMLINKAIAMGISDKVTFTGFKDNVERYYRIADCYVMPSVSEPFGITALEAMCSNIPCILSRQSGVSEVARHCFTVDFWDVDEMANKIIGMLKYKPLRKEMSDNGFREATSFNWLNVADETLKVYNKLLGGNAGA